MKTRSRLMAVIVTCLLINGTARATTISEACATSAAQWNLRDLPLDAASDRPVVDLNKNAEVFPINSPGLKRLGTGFSDGLQKLTSLDNGYYIFVMGENGAMSLIQGEMTSEGVKAPSGHFMLQKLLKQKEVAAGEFFLKDRQFQWVTNRSGTFQLDPQSFLPFTENLANANLKSMLHGTRFYAETSQGSVLLGRVP